MINRVAEANATKCAAFKLLEDGILLVCLFEGAEIGLEDSKQMQQISLSITGGNRFVVLIDARAELTVSKESREWGSTEEGQKNLVAQAILVNSLANRLVGNFIIKFHKPKAKTRLFSDEQTALSWLREQKRIACL